MPACLTGARGDRPGLDSGQREQFPAHSRLLDGRNRVPGLRAGRRRHMVTEMASRLTQTPKSVFGHSEGLDLTKASTAS